jgi:hypothetical protein
LEKCKEKILSNKQQISLLTEQNSALKEKVEELEEVIFIIINLLVQGNHFHLFSGKTE